MDILSLLSQIALWVIVVLMAFLLIGTLKSLGSVRWRLAQLEAVNPSHVGRRGLRVGSKAPDFLLPSLQGGQISVRDFIGGKVFLAFIRPGCAPCNRIIPTLNQLHKNGAYAVLAITIGEVEALRQWIDEVGAEFPVLIQENLAVSRSYEALATPFVFVIDEGGIIIAKGIVSESREVDVVLSQAARESRLKADNTWHDSGQASFPRGWQSGKDTGMQNETSDRTMT